MDDDDDDVKPLAAFDFDQTLLQVNSDIEILKLIPAERQELPGDVLDLRAHNWNDFMAAVFRYMKQCAVSEQQILDFIRKMPMVDQAAESIKKLKSELSADVIIVSDANSVFIEQLLDSNGLTSFVDALFTNPAEFSPDGCLILKPYSEQTSCQMCRKNMCKGSILQDFLSQQRAKGQTYSFVMMTGDGSNDLCPMLRLTDKDVAFPRQGYPIQKSIERMKQQGNNIVAQVVPWVNIDTVVDIAKDKIQAIRSGGTPSTQIR